MASPVCEALKYGNSFQQTTSSPSKTQIGFRFHDSAFLKMIPTYTNCFTNCFVYILKYKWWVVACRHTASRSKDSAEISWVDALHLTSDVVHQAACFITLWPQHHSACGIGHVNSSRNVMKSPIARHALPCPAMPCLPGSFQVTSLQCAWGPKCPVQSRLRVHEEYHHSDSFQRTKQCQANGLCEFVHMLKLRVLCRTRAWPIKY